MSALADAKPDAIVMALYPEQALALMQARARAQWPGRMVSVGPLTDEASLAMPDGSSDGTLGFCYYPDPRQSDVPGVVRYRAAMARAYPGRTVDRYSLYGYTFGRLVVEGVTRAGREADTRALCRRDGEPVELGRRRRDAGRHLLKDESSRATRRLHLRDAERPAGRAHRLD